MKKNQTMSRLQEIIQPSPNPTPSDKMLLRLWKKILTEIYRNIQTLAFKVLQKFRSWASRNCESILFLMSSESRFVKKLRFFD